MPSKSLKTKQGQALPTATRIGPKPADFPLGSVESRAVARAMLHKLAEKDGPQPGDIWIDLTSLTPQRATQICRTLRALKEQGPKAPEFPDASPRMWLKWPEGFDPDAAFESDPALTIDQVTEDDLRDFLRVCGEARRKAEQDGISILD